MNNSKLISWEKTIEILRKDPSHRDLIFYSYLTENLEENCSRFYQSEEFQETLKLIKRYHPKAQTALDIPAGNGIATFALKKSGFQVTTVEPDPSLSVGTGAIRKVLDKNGLDHNIIEAYGESLPLADNSFDLVYVRQGLHHASNLPQMLRELSRVLRPGGLLVACREHVVDNYNESLKMFLDSQVDHQLYGGENAFTLSDYIRAIQCSPMKLISVLAPFDSVINFYPTSEDKLISQALGSKKRRLVKKIIPNKLHLLLSKFILNKQKTPGRAYSFIAQKTQ